MPKHMQEKGAHRQSILPIAKQIIVEQWHNDGIYKHRATSYVTKKQKAKRHAEKQY